MKYVLQRESSKKGHGDTGEGATVDWVVREGLPDNVTSERSEWSKGTNPGGVT